MKKIKDEMGRTCGIHVGAENCIKFCSEHPKELVD
jgi:hypothetical protein